MDKESCSVDESDEFRVLSQYFRISDVSFRENSFIVHSELCLLPLRSNLRQISINIGPDIFLPNELPSDFDGKITINGYNANYTKKNPFKLLSSCTEQNLSSLLSRMEKIYEEKGFELIIEVPEECYEEVNNQVTIEVSIDAKVIKAKQAIHFIGCFNRDGVLEKGAHMYTFRSNVVSSTRHWLPCLDSPHQLCLWRFEIMTDAAFTAVASGELIDVVYTNDLLHKIYYYQLLIPTSATNIGIAIGHFIPHVQPDLPEITSFALPSLMPLVKHTVASLDRVFEFFEELLSCRFPFSSYKQVFVDQAAQEVTSFTGLTIMSVNILYHKKILDVVQYTRSLIASAVAEQFFGCFVNAARSLDLWLMKSLARYVTGLFIERYFGISEYLFQIEKMLNSVCEFESKWGKIYLRPPKKEKDSSLKLEGHSDPHNPYTCSPHYTEALFKKGHFIMRVLSKKLGAEPFLQVVQKILTVSMQFSQKHMEPTNWHYMSITTESFFRTVSSVTGSELPTFLEQWVYGGGHANFLVIYTFNRKRNMIELEVKQEENANIGRQSYVGPVTIVVQELDGCFTHTIQIDSDQSRHDLQCHSKGRRQKKKKIPLSSGEELEIDLGNMDPDSPVLWIKFDPELLLVRKVSIRQPVYQWEYMLKYERDVLAQLQALIVLQRFPSPHMRNILFETLENENFYYRVRCRAAFCLTEVVNKLPETWLGSPVLLKYFKKNYGCKSAPHIPKLNNFVVTAANLQSYFLMQAIPQAFGRLRTTHIATIYREVLDFVLGLIKFNDNSLNRYSDDHYRAALLNALIATVIPYESTEGVASPDRLNQEVKDILSVLTHALNMDTLKPTFGRVVGIGALQGIYQLQINSYLPLDYKIFLAYAQPKIFYNLRRAALTILVDIVHRYKGQIIVDLFSRLIEMCVTDPEPGIRYHIVSQLCSRVPYMTSAIAESNQTVNITLKEIYSKIWLIITDNKTDSYLRSYFMDFWFILHGMEEPKRLIIDDSKNNPYLERKSVVYRSGMPNEFSAEKTWHDAQNGFKEPDSPLNNAINELSDDLLQ